MNNTQTPTSEASTNVITQLANVSGQTLENILEDSQLGPDLNLTDEEIRDLRENFINTYSLSADSLKLTTETKVREIVAEIQENIENN